MTGGARRSTDQESITVSHPENTDGLEGWLPLPNLTLPRNVTDRPHVIAVPSSHANIYHNDSSTSAEGHLQDKHKYRLPFHEQPSVFNSSVTVGGLTIEAASDDTPKNSSWSHDDIRSNQYAHVENMREVTAFGMDQMRLFYEVTEPGLYHMGAVLSPRHPGVMHAEFNWQDQHHAYSLARYAHATLHIFSRMHDLRTGFRFHKDLPTLPDATLLKQCPMRNRVRCSGSWQKYRTANGQCNNPHHPSLGSAFTAYRRLLPAEYADGVQEIRRSVDDDWLPSARTVSAAVLRDVGDLEKERIASNVSHLLMQLGQFLDHDLSATPQSFGFNGSVPRCCAPDASGLTEPQHMHPECLAIPVDRSDSHFSLHGVRCLQFVRSAPAPMNDCALGSRQQANAVTAFLDGSAIYGSTEQRQLELRLFHQGFMNSMPGSRIKAMLPTAPPGERVLCRHSSGEPCLRAGDFRVNEHPGLTAMHVLWLREHNRVATELRALNPLWNDERLYQESRRVVVAELQHITLHEFLPLVLGPDGMKVFELDAPYAGYNPNVDPSIPNAFAAAAYRFGHSLVQDSLNRCNVKHQPIPSNTTLHEELAVPGIILSPRATEKLLLGLSQQSARSTERLITRELTDHLFEFADSGPGLDLAAINIQRGRDHGLPAYNRWRAPCGLRTLQHWDDLQHVTSTRFAATLPRVYRHVDDVDLYVGGIAERPVPGGLVGPTFACIIGQTFADLRAGDRFWYEEQGSPTSFTSLQLTQLKNTNFARLLCDNLEGVRTMPTWPLRSKPSNATAGNKKKCSDTKKIPQIDLTPWKEQADDISVQPVSASSITTSRPFKPQRPKPQRPRPQLIFTGTEVVLARPVAKPNTSTTGKPGSVNVTRKPTAIVVSHPGSAASMSLFLANLPSVVPTFISNMFSRNVTQHQSNKKNHKPGRHAPLVKPGINGSKLQNLASKTAFNRASENFR